MPITHTYKRCVPLRCSIRSQSAMEYLMTYGWAILIIAVVLAVLFQLGVFSSGNFQPHAQAGSCQVSRTVAGVSLEGQCNGLLPEYVVQFSRTAIGYAQSTITASQQTSQITVSFWIDPVNYGTYGLDCGTQNYWQSPVQGYSGGPSSFIFIIETCGAGDVTNPGLDWQVNNYRISLSDAGKSLTANTWQQVVGTFDGTSSAIYLNGQLIFGPSNANGNTINYGTLRISSTNNAPTQGNNYVSGSMANVQVYNTSLSASEIQALYLEGIGGAPIRPQNLIAWYPLNGNLNDYSGNNNNAVPSGIIPYSSSWENGYTAP